MEKDIHLALLADNYRQSERGTGFICHCDSTLTFNSSLQCCYKLCLVARDTVLQAVNTTAQVNVQVPSEGEVIPLHSSNSSSSTSISHGPTLAVQVVETTIGQRIEEKMIKRHQVREIH